MADGIYSNLAVINHSPSEFVLDFIQMMPGLTESARVKARVILTPQHAKRLISALDENVAQIRDQHTEKYQKLITHKSQFISGDQQARPEE